MEEPDEVIHYFQVRAPAQTGWTTVASGTADEVERALREWHEGEAAAKRERMEGRLCRVERFYGPVIRLGATIAAGEQDVAERRSKPHPSE